MFSLCLSLLVFARDKLSKECLRLHVDIEYTPQWPCHSSPFIAQDCVRVQECVFVSPTCDGFSPLGGTLERVLKRTLQHERFAVWRFRGFVDRHPAAAALSAADLASRHVFCSASRQIDPALMKSPSA